MANGKLFMTVSVKDMPFFKRMVKLLDEIIQDPRTHPFLKIDIEYEINKILEAGDNDA
jgi:hypothetical protein